ncbi:MAG: hypothetical protein WC979_01975 [Candidatus Pacearchaeota archaeon]|jgi:hypothetical protein|nr:hypothetical protein [Clostridia bacterium]
MKQRIPSLDDFINEGADMSSPSPIFILVGMLDGSAFYASNDSMKENATKEDLSYFLNNLKNGEYTTSRDNVYYICSTPPPKFRSVFEVANALCAEISVSHYVNFFALKGSESANEIGFLIENKGTVTKFLKATKYTDMSQIVKEYAYNKYHLALEKLPSGNLNTKKLLSVNVIPFKSYKEEIIEPK